MRNEDGSAHPLTKVLVALCVILIVCAAVLQVQVIQRNSRLDKLKDSTERTEDSAARTEKAVEDIHRSSLRIEVIAEDFAAGDPEQAAALQELFRKIDAIYQATVPPTERVSLEKTGDS